MDYWVVRVFPVEALDFVHSHDLFLRKVILDRLRVSLFQIDIFPKTAFKGFQLDKTGQK